MRRVILFFCCVMAASAQMRLTLPEAEQLAVKNNPQISQAEFQVKAYDEVTREFRSAYFPTVQGNITAVGADSGSRLAAGGLNNPIVYDRVAGGLTLGQLITDFGRTQNLVGSASLNAQAQREGVTYTRADLILRTDAAYVAVLRDRALLDVARETVSARQQVVDQVSALFNSKLKSSLDLSFANVNLADAKIMLSAAENNMRSAEAQLARLLVVPIDTRFDLTAPTDQPALPPDSAQLIAEAMKERPDLRMRRLQVESADKFASAEHDLKRPTVSMLGTAGYVPAGEAQIPGNYGALGLNIAIPVFNGGLFRARQFEADARAAAEQKGVQNLELQISQDVRDAWLSARNAYDQLQLTQQLFDQAKLALDLAQARYKLGLSSIVELSQSQLQYTNAEIQHTRAGYDYFAQKRVLEFETGLIH